MANYNNPQTGLMGVYDARETTCTVNGQIMYGFDGSGNMVQFTQDNDNVTVATDPQGTSVASKNNRNTCTFTINLSQESPCNAILMELASLDITQGFPVTYQTSTERIFAPHCYISKVPDSASGESAGAMAWTIHGLNFTRESLLSA